jgi:hypothetical protein
MVSATRLSLVSGSLVCMAGGSWAKSKKYRSDPIALFQGCVRGEGPGLG